MVNLGDVMPNFKAATNEGEIQFHDFIKGSWAILFSHPADFTPVCTTELSQAQKLAPEFQKRGVKMVALSCDDAESHQGWIKDIKHYTSDAFSYPIIADPKREIATSLGMLDPEEKDKAGMPLTCRAVFIIGPDAKLKLSFLYPATTGRNFDEIIRVIDSLQLTATKKVATPVNWKPGDEAMVVPSVKSDNEKTLFPKGVRHDTVPSGKAYMRFTKDY
ncbi:peroxiredoxin-6-like [Hydractinia symbiolongicarpus]|uniref:peroxiredoxin-6-like n=1 Tax=Hydractinia symbiolongicarpus TaxID=13093 RepID=UPI00254B7D73|nr:peroxiredoxin-6-like [Hydractinia symbiolongicarpus]